MSKEVKVLGPSVGYVEMLNYYTQEIIDEKAKAPSKYSPLRPSAAGKCTRELGFEQMEYRGYASYEKTPNTPEVHRLLDFGYAVENHVLYQMQAAFKRMPKPIEIKYKQHTLSFFKLPDGTRVEGNIDMVLVSEKWKVVADVKSKKDKFSAFYKSSWEELSDKLVRMASVHKFGEESYWVEDLKQFIEELDDAYFAMNFMQLNLYFHDEHHFLREKGVDHAAIFQFNKNDSRMREIRFKPCDKLYEEVKAKFESVQKVIDETKDPMNLPADFALGSSKCGFCNFRKKCYPDTDAMKDHFKTYPPKRWPKDLNRLDRELQDQLYPLFKVYSNLVKGSDELEKIERKIVNILDNAKINKIRLSDDEIFEVKQLKSGGPAGGPRAVLRRSKL